jgi:hypothetical protein
MTSWSDPSSIHRDRICTRIPFTDPRPRWSDHLLWYQRTVLNTYTYYGTEKMYAIGTTSNCITSVFGIRMCMFFCLRIR